MVVEEEYLIPGKLPQTVGLSLGCVDGFWAGRAAGALGAGCGVVSRRGLPPKAPVTGCCVMDFYPCRPARGVGGEEEGECCDRGGQRDEIHLPFPLQIKIIRRVSLELTAEQDHVQVYQYKIQDKNVTFFARGLSAAVL